MASSYVGRYKARCEDCDRKHTVAAAFCPWCGEPTEMGEQL